MDDARCTRTSTLRKQPDRCCIEYAPLVSRLQLIGTAVAKAPLATLPERAVGPRGSSRTRRPGSELEPFHHGRHIVSASRPLARLERRIREDFYESWPVPAVLPTIDRTRLDELDESRRRRLATTPAGSFSALCC